MQTLENFDAFMEAMVYTVFDGSSDETKREEFNAFWRAAVLDRSNLAFLKLFKLSTFAALYIRDAGVELSDEWDVADERRTRAIAEYVEKLSEQEAKEKLHWALEEAFRVPVNAVALLKIAHGQREAARRLNARRAVQERLKRDSNGTQAKKREAESLWKGWHCGDWAGNGERPRTAKAFKKYVVDEVEAARDEKTVEKWMKKWREEYTRASS